MHLPQIQPNPHYGDGYFLRALRIATPSPGTVLLGMEDSYHAFEISFAHDGTHVTSIDTRWHRHPMSACSGAVGAIDGMVGCRVDGGMRELQAYLDHRQQCTHIFDMFRLGVLHAFHGREDRRYDVIVHDAPQQPQVAQLLLNGVGVLSLTLENDVILAPEKYRGVNVFHGFGTWIAAHLDGEKVEQAFMLQRALFVAGGRRLDLAASVGSPSSLSGPPTGSCYASQPERYPRSVRLDNTRELWQAPGEVLRFLPAKRETGR
ncbi:DUF2889 domain-containing protein [Massilia cavernae]|uniref:DUF2889 domain-containing protein n=1 Tax=Massilia cavernae TaxID=2320864 RepID=A0A418Y0Q8_9BURK|nr:DUF2889 domain-containing protein [Massilia cavernae]RJG18847.1 DUF2889 domain-containing protein [Massilia cavernae]